MRSAQDIERAVKATCLAGLASGALHVVVAFWGASGQLQAVGIHLVGALLTFVCAFGVTRFSRVAAAGLVAVTLLTQLLAWGGEPSQVRLVMGIFSLFFLLIFARGLQATFAYHRLSRRFETWQRTMDAALDPRLFEEE